MGLAREQKDDGSIGVVHHACEALAVAQEQSRTLVGREAPCEADRENVGPRRIQQAGDVTQLRRARSLAHTLAIEPFPDAGQHARFDFLRRRPVTVIRNALQGVPEGRVAQALAPVRRQLAVEEVDPGQVQERRHVHAVGHETDRVLLGPDLRPLIDTQLSGHPAVYPADRIDPARPVQSQACHVEKAGGRTRAREIQNALERHPELPDEVAEVSDHEVVAERIVTGGDRRVGREDAVGGNGLQSGAKGKPL